MIDNNITILDDSSRILRYLSSSIFYGYVTFTWHARLLDMHRKRVTTKGRNITLCYLIPFSPTLCAGSRYRHPQL